MKTPAQTSARALLISLIAGVLLATCLQAGSGTAASASPGSPPAFQRGFQGPPPGGPGGFPGPGGRGGPGVREEQKVVAMFDKDGDKRLNAAERQAARAWLSQQGGGFGRRGGRGFPGRGAFAGPPDPSPRLTPADVQTHPSTPLYDLGTLRTIFFQFEDEDWEQELADFYNTDVEVPAMLTVEGKVYRDVGVSYRGNSSYFMVPAGYKRSLNVSVDFVDKDQRIGGYRTLHLLNGAQDPTFARVVLYALVGREYIPMPKANAMRVAINGENRGIYINTQAFNKDFLKEWFGSDNDGPRWKVPGSPGARSGGLSYLGDSAAAYKSSYELKTKDTPKAWADLMNLCRVLNETPPAQLEAALAPVLDVDEALKFLALDIAFVNSDGYWTRGSDYNLYEDAKGRFHIVPHDFNEAFGAEEGRGRFGFGGGGAELDPLVGLNDSSKPLRSKLLAVPALRARYLSYVRQIAERSLDWAKLGPTLRTYQMLIAPTVEVDTRKLYSFDAFGLGGPGSPATTLRGFVEARRGYLLGYKE